MVRAAVLVSEVYAGGSGVALNIQTAGIIVNVRLDETRGILISVPCCEDQAVCLIDMSLCILFSINCK